MSGHNDLEAIIGGMMDGRLLDRRMVFISEGVDSRVAKRVNAALLTMDNNEKAGEPITIYLNSPGGEVNSGFAIYDTIKFIKSPVTIISAGLTASIATVILVAVPKKSRITLPNSKFLIHQPLIPGQVYGQASDLEITAREILKTRKKINELLSKECGQPLAKVEQDTTRDYWLNAMEAMEYGLVSRIVENRKDI